MRNVTVKFADGSSHIYSNVPDDVTPEQVTSRANSDFGLDVTEINGGRKSFVTSAKDAVVDFGRFVAEDAGLVAHKSVVEGMDGILPAASSKPSKMQDYANHAAGGILNFNGAATDKVEGAPVRQDYYDKVQADLSKSGDVVRTHAQTGSTISARVAKSAVMDSLESGGLQEVAPVLKSSIESAEQDILARDDIDKNTKLALLGRVNSSANTSVDTLGRKPLNEMFTALRDKTARYKRIAEVAANDAATGDGAWYVAGISPLAGIAKSFGISSADVEKKAGMDEPGPLSKKLMDWGDEHSYYVNQVSKNTAAANRSYDQVTKDNFLETVEWDLVTNSANAIGFMGSGAAKAYLVAMGMQSYGDALSEGKSMGLATSVNHARALGKAIGEVGSEYLPIGAVDWIAKYGKTIPGATKKAFIKRAAVILGVAPVAAAVEGAEEYSNSVWGAFVDNVTAKFADVSSEQKAVLEQPMFDQKRDLSAAMHGAMGGGLGGIVASAKTAYDLRDNDKLRSRIQEAIASGHHTNISNGELGLRIKQAEKNGWSDIKSQLEAEANRRTPVVTDQQVADTVISSDSVDAAIAAANSVIEASASGELASKEIASGENTYIADHDLYDSADLNAIIGKANGNVNGESVASTGLGDAPGNGRSVDEPGGLRVDDVALDGVQRTDAGIGNGGVEQDSSVGVAGRGDALAFLSPSDIRGNSWKETARKHGITDESVLDSILPQEDMDEVTGFHLDADRVPTVVQAIKYVNETGKQAHLISADVFGLGAINDHVHQNAEEANKIFRKISDLFSDAIGDKGAVKIRGNGGKLYAVVTGLTTDQVNAVIQSAKEKAYDYADKAGLSDLYNKKTPMVKGTGLNVASVPITANSTVAQVFSEAESALDNDRHPSAISTIEPHTGKAAFKSPPVYVSKKSSSSGFLSPEKIRINTLVAKLREAGISAAESIRALIPQSAKDSVTGFYPAIEKVRTIKRAMQAIDVGGSMEGKTLHWVEADISNLGGMNRHVKNMKEANKGYRALSDIAIEGMENVGEVVIPIRTGGDEFGFVVIGATNAQIEAAKRNVTQRVKSLIRQNAMDKLPHLKYPGDISKIGVGLYLGSSEIESGDALSDIFNEASDGIKQAKEGLNNGGSTSEDGAGAPSGQAAGIGSSTNQVQSGEGAKEGDATGGEAAEGGSRGRDDAGEISKATRNQRPLKRRVPKSDTLLKVLRNRGGISRASINDVVRDKVAPGGYNWIFRNDSRNTVESLVEDGALDDFLPPGLRLETLNKPNLPMPDMRDAVDYIKEKIANGERVIPYDAAVELEQKGYEEQAAIEAVANLLSEDEINAQLQIAAEEQARGRRNAEVFNAPNEDIGTESSAGTETREPGQDDDEVTASRAEDARKAVNPLTTNAVDSQKQESVSDKSEREGVRQYVEALIKRRSAANQMGKSRSFDNALVAAKSLLNGEQVKPSKFKNALLALSKDKSMNDALMALYDIAKSNVQNQAKTVGEVQPESSAGAAQSDKDAEPSKAISDFTFNHPVKDENGPAQASVEAMEKAKSSDTDTIVMEVTQRPSGRVWYHAYVSDGNGGFDGISIGSSLEKETRDSLIEKAREKRAAKADREAKAENARKDSVSGAIAIGIKPGTTWSGAQAYVTGRDGLVTYDKATIQSFDKDTGAITVDVYKRGMRAPERIITDYKSRLFDNYPKNPDLLGDNTAKQQAIADAERDKDEKRNAGESNANEFTMTGSDRPADQAAARGAQDLFADAGNKPDARLDVPPEQSDYSLEAHDKVFERVYSGDITSSEFKAAFESFVKNEDKIISGINNLTKQQIFARFPGLTYRYKSDRKEIVSKAAYNSMLDDFSLSNSISYSMGEKYVDVIRRIVDKIGNQELEQYAEKVKASIAERKSNEEKRADGMQNPQTLDDYTNLLRSIMADGKTLADARLELTQEQREEYDNLASAKTRSEREARDKGRKTQVQVTAQTTSGEIIETKHTKTGEDLFVVKAADRVERETYAQWNTTAKRLGGWYSSYRGNGAVPGFQFKARENSEAFLQYLGGNAEQAKEALQVRRDAYADDKSQTAVERLTEMADRLEDSANESLGRDRKANTSRRARFAASAEAAANADKAMAKTMRNIAAGIESGTAKLLDQVRQKIQVEMLQGFVRTANDDMLRKLYPTYAEQEKHKYDKPTKEAADYAAFPSYTAYRSDLASLGRAMLETEVTRKLGQRIMSVADDVSDIYLAFARDNLHKVSRFSVSGSNTPAIFPSKGEAEAVIARSGFNGKAIVLPFKRGQNIIVTSPSEAIKQGIWEGDNDKRITLDSGFGAELVEKIGKAARRGARISVPWQFDNAYDKRKRLGAMGIETPAEFRAALREFIGLREIPKEADKIKQMERAMIGRNNDGLDFFPTPSSVADEMIDAADIKEGMTVLEPSAGMGHIADRIREAGVEPDVVELSGNRRELLEEKGYNVVGNDFMSIEGKYDRIIMNPPFGDRRDAAHVQHAYDLLNPGGRIVSLMGEGVFFGQDKKAQEFRDWLDQLGATDEKLEEGTFNDPSLPVNTGVNARMVVIDKPETDKGVALFSRATDNNWYYSQLSKAVDSAKFESAPANQWKLWLNANAGKLGVKQDEIQWTGVADWLDLQQGKVSKADIQAYLDGNGVQVKDVVLGRDYNQDGTTKYSQYTVPGGENYKELLLTLPVKKLHYEKPKSGKIVDPFANSLGLIFGETDSAEGLVDAPESGEYNEPAKFQSPHFDQPNILAHVRFDERTDAEGNKVLFIGEIQSDWGQKGKKEGFAAEPNPERLTAIIQRLRELAKVDQEDSPEWDALTEEKNALQKQGTPSAPFVTDTKAWVSLAIKRMISYAAENGFDKVAFINGQQAADLYDLSKQVDSVKANKDNGKYNIYAEKSGDVLIQKQGLHIDEVAEIVGKDLAAKIETDSDYMDGGGSKRYSGLDLKVGGEGMRAFYDEIVPSVARDVLRKLGVSHNITPSSSVGLEAGDVSASSASSIIHPMTINGSSQPGFTITPAIREKAAAGLPLFAKNKTVARGMSVDRVQSLVDGIKSKWKNAPDIVVVESINDQDIPQRVREENERQLSQGATGQPEGFFYDGKVYLVASQLHNATDVSRVIFHETLGHYGLRGTFGDSLKPILRQVILLRRNDVINKAKSYGLTRNENDLLAAAEEVLAEMAQNTPDIGVVKRAIAAIRKFLRDIGVDLQLTDSDIIANYLIPARRFVENGGKPGGGVAFSRGEYTGPKFAIINALDEMKFQVKSNEGEIIGVYPTAEKAKQVAGSFEKQWMKEHLKAQKDNPAKSSRKSDQTETPEFRKWFGDSKVVDDQGKPLVVYHGTDRDFNSFKDKNGRGAYFFAFDPDEAERFADGAIENSGGGEAIVIPAYLSASNIFDARIPEHRAAVGFKYRDGDSFGFSELERLTPKIKAAGFDGYYDTEYSAELTPTTEFSAIAVFDPTQIKSAIGNNGEFDPSNPNILLSRSTSGGKDSSFNIPGETSGQTIRRLHQDKLIRIKIVQDAIAKQGGEVGVNENVYLAMERSTGRIAERMKHFRIGTQEPLMKRVAKLNTNLDEIGTYLMALGAKDRNALIQSRRDDMPNNGSGLTNGQAAEIITDYKKREDFADFDKLARDIQAITKAKLEMLVKSKVMTKDQAKEWSDAQPFYVPFKGFEVIDDDLNKVGNGVGVGYSTSKRASPKAMGRISLAGQVVENIIRDYNAAIILSEKAQVGEYMHNLVDKNPDPYLWTISEPEKVAVMGKKPFKYEVYYHGSLVDEFYNLQDAKKFADSKRNINDKPSSVEIITQGGEATVIKRDMGFDPEKEIRYIKDGKELRIQIHDPLFVRAYNNLGAEKIGYLAKAASDFGSFLREMYVQKNPNFLIKNTIRDSQTAFIVLTGELGASNAAKVMALAPKAAKASFSMVRDVEANAEWEPYIKLYNKSGAGTAFAMLDDIETQQLKLDETIAKHGNQGVVDEWKRGISAANQSIDRGSSKITAYGKAVTKTGRYMIYRALDNAVLNTLEALNGASENAYRLAAFRFYIDDHGGVENITAETLAEASRIAKNVTINFNRAGEHSSSLNAFYLFWKASINGSANVHRALTDTPHKKQAQAISAGLFSLGVMMAMLTGDDDDELSAQYDKEHNLLIHGDGTTWKLILAYGFGFFYGAGYTFGNMLKGRVTPMHAAVNTIGQFFDNFSPVGSPVVNDEFDSKAVALMATPTILDPVTVVATNQTSFGNKLVPHFSEQDGKRDSETMYRGTRGTWYDKAANSKMLAWADISPETMKYIVNTLTGGSGGFLSGVYKTAADVFSDKPIDIEEAPLVKNFYSIKDIDEYRGRFYEQTNNVKDIAIEKGKKQSQIIGVSVVFLQKQMKRMRDREDAARARGDYDSVAKFELKQIEFAKRFNTRYHKAMAEQD